MICWLLLFLMAMLFGCSNVSDNSNEKINLIKKSIEIPLSIEGSKLIAWESDTSYIVFSKSNAEFYRVHGELVDTLIISNKIATERSGYENMKQNENGIVTLVDVSNGVYVVKDSAYGIRVPGSTKMVSGAVITNDGSLYAWGATGVWKTNLDEMKFAPHEMLFDYNIAGMYFYDTLGLISYPNGIKLFSKNKILGSWKNQEIGLEENTNLLMSSDWFGKVGEKLLIVHDSKSLLFDAENRLFEKPITESLIGQIISFTDGDCTYSKRLDLYVWCDDGGSVYNLEYDNSNIGDADIYVGKNSEGYWVSDGRTLMLLDLELAKKIARSGSK